MLGRICTAAEPMEAARFALLVKSALGAPGVRFFGAGRPVRRVGLSSGSGGSLFLKAVHLGCDTFLSGELKYGVYLQAQQLGVNLVEAGHFHTEHGVCPGLARLLRDAFPEVKVFESSRRGDGASFI
jgi:putative NIF3 family GTP cyclohydrolase 1 type 2